MLKDNKAHLIKTFFNNAIYELMTPADGTLSAFNKIY